MSATIPVQMRIEENTKRKPGPSEQPPAFISYISLSTGTNTLVLTGSSSRWAIFAL